MRPNLAVIAVFSTLAAVLPSVAFAADPTIAVPAAEVPKPIKIIIDNYAVAVSTGDFLTAHEITIDVDTMIGDVAVGGEAIAGLAGTFGPVNDIALEMPTLMLYAESPVWGRVEVLNEDGALDAACIIPTPGTTHFDTEDLMTVSTCAGYADGLGITYKTPDFNGFSIRVSAMGDPLGVIDVGAVDASVSAALAYETTMDDVTWSASLGVDHGLSVKGGLPAGQALPTTIQAGLAVGVDDWLLGVAAQYEISSPSGGDRWAAGIGLSREVFEGLTLAAELSTDQYDDAGVTMREVGIGTTAEYAFIPDKVLGDVSANLVRRTGGGGDVTIGSVGAGLSVAF